MKCKHLSKIGFQIFMNPSSFRSTMNPMRSSSTFHVPPELTEILQAKSHNYKRYYLTLKSQQTVIQNFLENLSKTVIDDDDKPTVATIESCANSLLNCTYGELLIITASTQNLVNSMISNSHGNKPIDKLIYHLLNSVMAINKLFTSIQNEFSKMPQIHDSSSNDSLDSLQNSPNNSLQTNHDNNNNANLTENFNGFEREENSEKSIIAHSPNTDLGLRGTILNFSDFDHNSTSNGNNNSNEKGESDSDIICEDDTILCRICDEHVRIDQFAEHTESCIKAYKYEEKIMLIYNRMLDLQNQICEYHLRVNWPGNAKEAVQVYLPLFRCSLLLERANEIDPKNEDAAEELGFIADIMTQISMSLIKSSMSELIMQIKEQVIAKKNTSIVIRRAAAVLKNTRISGNADTNKSSQINISDFDFIKRISSGAFARVFLAKKKVSSDIYAIKVLPKDDVVQKNQVKRVVLEKDILLKFNNPYIINFCMFF
ncbi:hypothetical protein TRFO_22193 [Tritrichomonas foetus]|uniref:non-specific serine/threonine protein kinase n=1 Tax=Tritrichomonas foetus TaxID=1144522 RepID=A0A1J4KGV2_9EUKA|nr:hypothetical protein TRFO_22193 [Tritrichomonas foetus]|eukprot:OHT09036.1 hypothetical protein TRFO_22193 [Tritrichomonas foetus]